MKTFARTGWMLCLALAASASTAAPQATEETPPQDRSGSDSKAAIDPRTGQLRPLTREERQQLQAADKALRAARRTEPAAAGKKGFVAPLTEAEAGANQRRLASGGIVQQVPESLMTDLVVVRNADGTLRIGHADADGQPVVEEVPHE